MASRSSFGEILNQSSPLTPQIICAALISLLLFGCGQGQSFPELEGEWIVEGLRCQGEARPRMVSFSGQEGEGIYLRGDDCISAGDLIWPNHPNENGDEVEFLVNSELMQRSTYGVEAVDENRLRLVGSGSDVDLGMRRVFPERSPRRNFELSGFHLGGLWWMEGYPCLEEQVPQMVSVFHAQTSLTFRKVIGDECIEDGESFFEGQISGTFIEGIAELEKRDFFDEDDGYEPLEATGAVYVEDNFRLDVHGVLVSFRRVLGDPL